MSRQTDDALAQAVQNALAKISGVLSPTCVPMAKLHGNIVRVPSTC
ncbi:hypothetical protein ACVITL_006583 [Rhizobium pisi]